MAHARAHALLFLALFAPACQAIDTEARSSFPLQGAWRLVAIEYVAADGRATAGTPQESLFLFADGRYSMGYSHHPARSPRFAAPFSPTEAERRERFSALVTNAGRYHLTDSRLVLRPEFALYPSVIDSETRIGVGVSGDTATLTYVDQRTADGVADPYYEGGAKYVLRLVRLRE